MQLEWRWFCCQVLETRKAYRGIFPKLGPKIDDLGEGMTFITFGETKCHSQGCRGCCRKPQDRPQNIGTASGQSPGFQGWHCDEAERCGPALYVPLVPERNPHPHLKHGHSQDAAAYIQTNTIHAREAWCPEARRAHTHVILVSQIGCRPMQR
jgi:hypothetical protein